MQQARELSIRRDDIQPALAGNMDALMRLITLPTDQFNQATALFLLEQANLVIKANPKNHCALTLKGFATSLAILEGDAGYNRKAALVCLEKAAALGNPWAMYLAGNLILQGDQSEKNLTAKAAKQYRSALRVLGENALVKGKFDSIGYEEEACYDYAMCFGRVEYGGDSLDKIEFLDRSVRTKNVRMKLVSQLLCDPDPQLTPTIKLDYATRLCPLSSERLSKEKDKEFLFAWGMLYAKVAKEALALQNGEQTEEKINLADDCLDRLKYLKADKSKLSELQDAIFMIIADDAQQNTDLDDPIAVFNTVSYILAVTIDTKKYFLLADLLMRMNTDAIFLNHKDKYRLIISLLSKIDFQGRTDCLGFNILLGQAICNLKNINTTIGGDFQPTGVCVRFEILADLIGGTGCAKLMTYAPESEDQLRRSDKVEAILTENFGTAEVTTFERILYNSYEDAHEGLDIVFLEEHLLTKFTKYIKDAKENVEAEQAAAKKSKSKTLVPDDVVIDHGNHGIGRKRLIARDKPIEGAEQHKRDLLIEALVRSIAELESTMKGSTAIYSHFADYPTHLSVAKELLDKCKITFNLWEVQSLVAKYLTEDKGTLHKYAFKLFFLRHLAQALNLGNIKTLEKEPDNFLHNVRTFLNIQSVANNPAPPEVPAVAIANAALPAQAAAVAAAAPVVELVGDVGANTGGFNHNNN